MDLNAATRWGLAVGLCLLVGCGAQGPQALTPAEVLAVAREEARPSVDAAMNGIPEWMAWGTDQVFLRHAILSSRAEKADKEVRVSPEDVPTLLRAMRTGRTDGNAIDLPGRLCLAVLLLDHKTPEARRLVEESLRDADEEAFICGLSALILHLRRDPNDAWAISRIAGLLREDRLLDTRGVGDFFSTAMERVCFEAGNLHAPEVVPPLIDLVQRHPDKPTGAVGALTSIGDRRAIPVLMETLQERSQDGNGREVVSLRPGQAWALGVLKAREAVDVLLQHIQEKAAIKALGMGHDERAIGPLRRYVDSPDSRHVFTARIALAWVEGNSPGERAARLARLYEPNLPPEDKGDLMFWLAGTYDPAAVPCFLHIGKTDPDGQDRASAIFFLSAIPGPQSVAALIELLGVDYSNVESAGSNVWAPDEYMKSKVCASLRRLTAQKIGNDPDAWRAWYKRAYPQRPR